MDITLESRARMRTAIKDKLEEIGANIDVYIDAELPDLVMMMVASNRTSAHMADRLSLFLGDYAVQFIDWLSGFQRKSLSAVEPSAAKRQLQSDCSTVSNQLSQLSVSENNSPSDQANNNLIRSVSKTKSSSPHAIKPHVEVLPSEAPVNFGSKPDDGRKAKAPDEFVAKAAGSHGPGRRQVTKVHRMPHSRMVSASSANKFWPTEGPQKKQEGPTKEQPCKLWPKQAQKAYSSKGQICRFWPNCKNGDGCSFIHLAKQCKAFPKCKLGDKCLFVHPNCKYEGKCTKRDCPFNHCDRRGTAPAPPGTAPQIQTPPGADSEPLNCPKMQTSNLAKLPPPTSAPGEEIFDGDSDARIHRHLQLKEEVKPSLSSSLRASCTNAYTTRT